MSASRAEIVSALRTAALLESLAAIEHERWSHWQRYLHSRCEKGDDGSLTIPPDLAARWTTQLSTPFAELSEQEKESDREQVWRYLPVIESALQQYLGREIEAPDGQETQ
ncbi:hypothetical protein [Glycomyces paridis]|uniref:Uncharacterized protein n=1 Tax=Glycomyces paridis TaxID=2126555 RepID=A0A4S8PH94_9ACTN|nr:hypothetical protein [Glycomyces paridis]THV28985.1 hypothetical protein E9998_09540 [Glycomyces paridis]